jgi:hypothetical protein
VRKIRAISFLKDKNKKYGYNIVKPASQMEVIIIEYKHKTASSVKVHAGKQDSGIKRNS